MILLVEKNCLAIPEADNAIKSGCTEYIRVVSINLGNCCQPTMKNAAHKSSIVMTIAYMAILYCFANRGTMTNPTIHVFTIAAAATSRMNVFQRPFAAVIHIRQVRNNKTI